MLWGVEDEVTKRFTQAGIAPENISFSREPFTFNFNGTPAEFVNTFKLYYGPTMNAFEAADKNGKAVDLQHELEVLFAAQNSSRQPDVTSITATYLQVDVKV